MPGTSFDSSGCGGLSIPAGTVGTIDQTAYVTTSNVVQGAVNIGVLTLLSDVISAVPTLQGGINHDRALLNTVIDALQSKGILG